jgi:hypothetical protein
MKRTPRRLIGMFIAVVALAAFTPATASAAISLTGSTGAPSNLAAGAHSDFIIHLATSGDDIKDLVISLPPGEVGNPQATPLCDPSQLPNCDANTQVGSVSSSVTIASLLPQTITGAVYNLKPNPGEPARFGIVLNANPIPIPLPPPFDNLLLPKTVVQSGASLRSIDFGLNTTVNNIPNSAALIGGLPLTVPVHINSMDLTLFGKPADHGVVGAKPFMRNPTSCTDHVVTFNADSHSSTTASPVQSHFTPTNCGALDFSPAFTAEIGGPGQTTNGVPTTASTAILQDTDEAGLLSAIVKVPGDLNPNATLFFGAHCPQASFLASACPSNTVVGLATAASPLLSTPLVGNVALVDGGTFPNLGLDLKGQLHLLLQGATNASSAGNTVTFNGLPDIPISRFQLTFTNPPGLLGTARDICTPPAPVFHADFTGYNGASTSVDSPATVDGCGAGNTGGKCKKHKAKKKHKHRAAESKKHKKKSSCKKKKHKKKHHK